jgi:hypothetical protein
VDLGWAAGAENSQDGSECISLLLVSITVHDKVDDDDDALGLVVVWASYMASCIEDRVLWVPEQAASLGKPFKGPLAQIVLCVQYLLQY